MEDIQRAFSEFKTQVQEIAEHADSVQKLSFKAELKNGTSFRFNYNADSFGPKQAYHPNSVFNGIVDVFRLYRHLAGFPLHGADAEADRVELSLILSFSFMVAVFVFSALYHFMHREKKSCLVFYNLKEIAKILALALINLTIATFFDAKLQITQSLSLALVP
jgi:hypothetical protein